MERKIEAELIAWKNSTARMPLVFYGARQVGKTFVVKNLQMNIMFISFI